MGGGLAVAGLSTLGGAQYTRAAEHDPTMAPPADPRGKGHCAAMDLDGGVLLIEDAAPKGPSHDYVGCRRELKAKLEPLLCARGKGRQAFLYRMSDNEPTPSSVLCD